MLTTYPFGTIHKQHMLGVQNMYRIANDNTMNIILGYILI
jgi:hypothetical protein